MPVVFVDSGSTDGSPELARRMGVEVVELDPGSPFTAGRARNEGFKRVAALHPAVELVQFVDGDCELVEGWMERGVHEMNADRQRGAVCGRVREVDRERSIYNRLCDMEWDVPPGEALACGGNTMMRAVALSASGGFDPRLIAGEEPELCLRLRGAGWKVFRVDADMVLHDGAALHGRTPERHWVRENRSALFWGTLVPATALILAVPSRGASLILLAAYPLLGLRIYLRSSRRGLAPRDARLLAFFTVLGKLPEGIGKTQYALLRALGRRRKVMDWRSPAEGDGHPPPGSGG
jgi:GT2 family glycosyltransferase